MSYGLGIDIGTTFSSAAISRNGSVELVTLGEREAAVRSMVHFDAEGTVTTGETAERRSQDDLSGTAKEFKRRLGDDTPILLAGTAFSAQLLISHQLRGIYDHVVERQGDVPTSVVVTHPGDWGPFKIGLLQEALSFADLNHATLATEPVAAAADHDGRESLDAGSLTAIYDLGGSTFNAAVVTRTDDDVQLVGPALATDRLGGNDIDQAIFDHVRTSLDGALESADQDDPSVRSALLRLRRHCVAAKEALSTEAEATIPVVLPGIDTSVRLTRAEFEAMVRPVVEESIATIRQTISDANVAVEDVSAILLAGGSSRIPLVGELLAGELGRPIVVDSHPRFAVARGAARLAAAVDDASFTPTRAMATVSGTVEQPTEPVGGTAEATVADRPLLAAGFAATEVRSDRRRRSSGSPVRSSRSVFAGMVVAAMLLTGGGAAAAFGAGPFGGDVSAGPSSDDRPTVEAVAEVEPTTTSQPTTTGPTTTVSSTSSTTAHQSTTSPTTSHHTNTTHHPTTTHPSTTTTTVPTTETTDHSTTSSTESTTTSTTPTTLVGPAPTTKEFPIPHTLPPTTTNTDS